MNKNFNFDYISEEDMKEYYWHRILIVGGLIWKNRCMINLTNLNLVNLEQILIICFKDPYESKHQSLIKKRERTGLKYLNDSKALIEFSNNMAIFIKILKNTIQIKKEKY